MNETSEGGTKFRSPPYPFIPLSKAIERAEQLFAKERDRWSPLKSAAAAWGYSESSSGGLQTVAALKHFGLLEDEGSGPHRKVRLTKAALRIVLDKRPESIERQAAIRDAALAPKIHREIWDKWEGEPPSPTTMKHYLTVDRRLAGQAPFSDQSADDLIAEYTATIAFAGLDGFGAMSEKGAPCPDMGIDAGTRQEDTATRQEAEAGKRGGVPATTNLDRVGEKEIRLGEGERELTTGLLSKDGATFRLIVSGRIGEKEIDRLIRKLELDREILAEDAKNVQDE